MPAAACKRNPMAAVAAAVAALTGLPGVIPGGTGWSTAWSTRSAAASDAPAPAGAAVPIRTVDLTRAALAEEGFELRWSAVAPLRENGAGPIVEFWLLGGAVIGRTSDNQLVAFDADTGSYRWIKRIGRSDRTMFTPTYNPPRLLPGGQRDIGRLYVTLYDRVHVIDIATGKTEEELSLSFLPCTAVVRERNVAVVGGENHRFYFLDGAKGYTITHRSLDGFLPYTPLFEDPDERSERGGFYFADSVGRVYSYSVNRSIYWEFPPGRENIGRIAGPLSRTPRIKNINDKGEFLGFQDYSLVFVPTDDNSLYALSKQSGKPRWQKRSNAAFRETAVTVVGRPESPLDQDRIYVRNEDRVLFALEPTKGDDVWALPDAGKLLVAGRNNPSMSVFLLEDKPGSPAFGSITEVVSKKSVVRTPEGERVNYTPEVRSRWRFGDATIFVRNVDDPVLFAATADGRFYAVRLTEGELRERKKDEQPPVIRTLVGKKSAPKDAAKPEMK